MTRNPVVTMAADMMNAIQALRLKRHQLVSTSDGIEIRQPGKPALLITWRAASDFAHEIEEAGQ